MFSNVGGMPGWQRSPAQSQSRSGLRHARQASAIGASLLAACTLLACAPEAPKTPVIIFVIDTLRADRLGAYGDSTARTPHIDALAAESALFESAHAAAETSGGPRPPAEVG